MNRWRISIDKNICVGSATCTALVPEFFALDEEERSYPRIEISGPHAGLIEAMEYCPTGAIRVTDAESDEPVAG